MRKILFLFISVLTLSFSLISCSNEDEKEPLYPILGTWEGQGNFIHSTDNKTLYRFTDLFGRGWVYDDNYNNDDLLTGSGSNPFKIILGNVIIIQNYDNNGNEIEPQKTVTFTLNGNELKILDSEIQKTYTYKRKK